MLDRDGLQSFWAWLKVYDKTAKHGSEFDLMDLREAWIQGVAWGRQHSAQKKDAWLHGDPNETDKDGGRGK